MQKEIRSLKTDSRPPSTAHVAFWVICVGGVGTKAGSYLLARFRSDDEPFSLGMLHVDTDPATTLDTEDRILLQLTASDVRAMRANPDRFGPAVTSIVQQLGRLLSAGDILNGSRTTRALTQLAFHYLTDRLCRAMRRSLARLRQRYKISLVMPVVLSSSGGGTGSASQILLMHLLHQADFRHRLLGGIASDLLLPPTSFVVEPYAYANETSTLQRAKILSNAYAFRLESEWMLQQGAASYVGHIGYANSGGTVLADPDTMAKVLGLGVYELLRGWPALKARWVDGPDDVASVANYGGEDIAAFDSIDGVRFSIRRKKS
jgi:hypothetical protein